MTRNTGYHWGALLGLLIASMVIVPLAGPSFIPEVISLALFGLSIIGAIFLGLTSAPVRILCGSVALIWFGATTAALLNKELNGAVTVLTVILLVGALFGTFRILMNRGDGDFDTLVGAIFGYLLLAMAWAMLYLHIIRGHPGAILYPDGSEPWTSMIYFSLITITSLGYGDILPVDPLARMAAGFEAVVGVLYIAVMIGNIVGSYRKDKT